MATSSTQDVKESVVEDAKAPILSIRPLGAEEVVAIRELEVANGGAAVLAGDDRELGFGSFDIAVEPWALSLEFHPRPESVRIERFASAPDPLAGCRGESLLKSIRLRCRRARDEHHEHCGGCDHGRDAEPSLHWGIVVGGLG